MHEKLVMLTVFCWQAHANWTACPLTLLAFLEAQDAELQRPLHPVGRRDQQRHADLVGGEGGRCAEWGRQAGQGEQCAGPEGMGVAYKKDIDDVRESPALDVIELLRQKGADVRYHDPYVPSIRHNGFHMQGEPDCRHGAGPGGLCGGGNGSFELRLGDGPTDG